MSNMFDHLLPESTRKLKVSNTFNISDTPDRQSVFKNIEGSNMFDHLLPESTKNLNFDNHKIYERSSDHELDAGDAFWLGLKDTYRGVKQMAGVDLENMERDQQRIRELLQRGDGLAKAAYFGGLLLDPAMWLIPVLRGKNLYSMAKAGAIAGGLAGGFGYVDDQSFFDTRTKQAFGGAITGGVLSPVIGKTAAFLKLKKLKKGFGLDREAPDVSKLPEKDFVHIPLPGKDDIIIGQADTLTTLGKKVRGRGDVSAKVRREATINIREDVDDVPHIFNVGDKVIISSNGATGTIVGFNRKNIQMGNATDNYIIKQDKKLFESMKDNVMLDKVSLDELNPIGKKSNVNFLLRGPIEFVRNIQNLYSKHIGRPSFDYITTGKFGPELGGGLAGALYGFSTEGLTGKALDPEDEDNMTKRLGRAFLGFMSGIAGISVMRNKHISKSLFEFADTITKTAPGVSNKITQKWLDNPDLTIASILARGLVDGYKLPKEFKKIEAGSFKGLQNTILIDAAKIAGKATQLTADENKVLYNMLEGDIVYDVPAKYLNQLRDEARANITDLTQKYVDLGLITDETAKLNIQKYLRRAYAGQNLARIADDIKARGIIETISPKQWLNEYSKIKAYKLTDEGTPQVTIAGRYMQADDHKGWELFGNILDSQGNVTSKRATLDEVKKLAKDPTQADAEIVNARWQFTKQERLGMGEIENAGFAIAETGRLMSYTLPRYDFYARLSEQPFTKSGLSRVEAMDLKYVRVPSEKRSGTLQPIFGKLAGKYVPEEVFLNLEELNKIAAGATTTPGKIYRKLNQLWKVSKTAWNPTVHVNNIISNLVLLDLVDGSYKYLPKAANAFMQSGRGKRSKIVELAEKHGVFDASMPEAELGRIRQPNVDNLSKIYTVNPKDNVVGQGGEIAEKFYKGWVKPLVGSKFGLDNLTDWYRREDEIFRLALFMDRLDKGYAVVDAAMDARKSFIDYNITAPGINWLRQYPTPFLAYTYRVIPILAETAFVRPWKYAKYAILGYMLNNAGDVLGGGDTKAERAAMTKDKQGRVLGLPKLPHRNVKLPLLGDKEGGSYLNITRYVPGGDILDLGSGNIMPGLPAPLQPSFGIAGDVLFPLMGFDVFGKKALSGQGISDFDDIKVRAKAISQRIVPNFPFVPGSYSTKRIERARKGKETSFRAKETELIAFFNAIGIKYLKTNIKKLRTVKGFEFKAKVRGVREQLKNEANKFRDGQISREEYHINTQEIKDNFYEIRDSYKKALGMTISAKEPTIISDIPRVIGGVLKERFKKLDTDFNYKKGTMFDHLLPESSR